MNRQWLSLTTKGLYRVFLWAFYSEREAREAGTGNYAVNKSVFLHVGINGRDPEKTKEFYVKYFNFKPARKIDVEGRQILFLSSGNISLELFKTEGEPSSDSPQKRRCQVCRVQAYRLSSRQYC